MIKFDLDDGKNRDWGLTYRSMRIIQIHYQLGDRFLPTTKCGY